MRVGGRYYAYGTSTGGAYLPVMTSTDLRQWVARPAYRDPSLGESRAIEQPGDRGTFGHPVGGAIQADFHAGIVAALRGGLQP